MSKLPIEFSVFNVMGGTKVDIKANDIIDASSFVVSEVIDRNKNWDARETEKHNSEDAVMINGHDKENGDFIVILVIKKALSENEDIFKEWKNMN